MAQQPQSASEQRQDDKQAKQLVVVELSGVRTPDQVRRLREGRGKLMRDIDEVIERTRRVGNRQGRFPAGRDRRARSGAAFPLAVRAARHATMMTTKTTDLAVVLPFADLRPTPARAAADPRVAVAQFSRKR